MNKNKLLKQVEKLNSISPKLTNFVLQRIVPYVGTSNVIFKKVTNTEVVCHVPNKRRSRNHIKQIHASCMILAAETATGFITALNMPDTSINLIKSLNTNFVRRSNGPITAVASITPEQIVLINTTEKGELVIPVKVTDGDGEEPIKVEALWAWTKKRKDIKAG